jgi:hypothetical protein
LAEYLTGFITEADRHRYLVAMRRDVKIYATMSPPNFGKVAKRLYNVCRLTGRFAEALYLREMFDEPMAMLYQARSPLEAIRRACASDPVSACTALTATLSDLTPLLAHDPVAETTFAKCWRVVHCPDEASVSAATEELGALIADHTNHLFRRGLFAFAPIAALLMECGIGNAGG